MTTRVMQKVIMMKKNTVLKKKDKKQLKTIIRMRTMSNQRKSLTG
jgi:hypothetical protein